MLSPQIFADEEEVKAGLCRVFVLPCSLEPEGVGFQRPF
ncbi:MAG: hypothetical protein CM15mP77_2140 [Synechococcus sp.]|nr:MAG: hypothetical protein CM15mP77_2140 [Synechococcus sp.]